MRLKSRWAETILCEDSRNSAGRADQRSQGGNAKVEVSVGRDRRSQFALILGGLDEEAVPSVAARHDEMSVLAVAQVGENCPALDKLVQGRAGEVPPNGCHENNRWSIVREPHGGVRCGVGVRPHGERPGPRRGPPLDRSGRRGPEGLLLRWSNTPLGRRDCGAEILGRSRGSRSSGMPRASSPTDPLLAPRKEWLTGLTDASQFHGRGIAIPRTGEISEKRSDRSWVTRLAIANRALR